MKDTDLLNLYYDVKNFVTALDELLASTSRPARYNQEIRDVLGLESKIHCQVVKMLEWLDLPKKRPPSDLTHE